MNKKGFTLIELLVVVLIIGILSSVALPQYTTAVEKARASEAWTTLKAINDAEKIRNMEAGTQGEIYPFEELSVSFTDKNGATATGTRFSGKHFEFYLGNYSRSGGSEPAWAWTNTRGADYALNFANGKKNCGVVDGSAKGLKMCKTLLSNAQVSTTCISGENCFSE